MLLVICQVSHDVTCSRLRDGRVYWIEKTQTRKKKKAGEHWRGEKAMEVVIISLNGLFWYTNSWYNLWLVTSTLPQQVLPVTQKKGVRLPCAWNKGIHNNFCVEQILVQCNPINIKRQEHMFYRYNNNNNNNIIHLYSATNTNYS